MHRWFGEFCMENPPNQVALPFIWLSQWGVFCYFFWAGAIKWWDQLLAHLLFAECRSCMPRLMQGDDFLLKLMRARAESIHETTTSKRHLINPQAGLPR